LIVRVAMAVLVMAACRSEEARPDHAAPEPRPKREVFVPEDPVAALGDLSALSPAERRAYEDHGFFAPIATPESGMWLYEHPEPGQTYDEYLASGPNVPNAERGTIYIQPLGELGRDLPLALADLERFTEAFFALPVIVLPTVAIADLDVTIRRRDKRPDQLLSTDVLGWLAARLPADAYACVAVTMADLYPEDSWSFVFGQASLSRRVGVYSFARFDDGFDGGARAEGWRRAFIERAFGVLAHEIGHMFGMAHCVHHACIMNGSNSLAESDAQPLHLCPVCLRKLQHTAGFDVEQREATLLPIYERFGLVTVADWTRRRLAYLRAKP